MNNKRKFKIGKVYCVKLLSEDGKIESEGIYTYKGFDNLIDRCQHIFVDTELILGARYNLTLIPDTLLDRYDISEIFI